ncbi:MAG: glycosyltransferase family 39 protein [Elusimicrobia bacterium]|nr:glycosyltransferase family 39 protein [Elusimicrobiota bacterium]
MRATLRRAAASAWAVQLLPAVAVGLALRLYLLPDQILLDDEWHALNFVLSKSLPSVSMRHGLGANCIPQNIYSYLLLHSAGWSEMLLRLPSLVCSALALAILPFMVQRIWGGRVAVIFAYLLAISPCVIFYSRLCRPYAAVLFFGMFSLLSLFRWLREDKLSHMLGYAVAAFMTVYLHLYAALFVVTPLLCLFGLRLLKRLGQVRTTLPSTLRLSQAAAIIVVLAALLIAPANIVNPWWMAVSGYSGATWQTWRDFWSLLSGTHWGALQLIFAALVLPGFFFVLRDDRVIGGLLLTCVLAFVLRVCTSSQEGIDVAIQIARYGIILFPIAFLLAAVSLARLLERLSSRLPKGEGPVIAALVPAVVAALFLGFGPLRGIYRRPNNFTNQSAFQYSYEPTDWSVTRERGFYKGKGLTMKKTDVPEVYFKLASASGIAGIIEYPMMLGDHFNQYYYYQVFHRKRTAIGYMPNGQFEPLPSKDDFIYGNVSLDYIFRRMPSVPEGSMHFRNLVALNDTRRLRASFSQWLIIVHNNIWIESLPGLHLPDTGPDAGMEAIARFLAEQGHRMVYKDAKLTILQVP